MEDKTTKIVIGGTFVFLLINQTSQFLDIASLNNGLEAFLQIGNPTLLFIMCYFFGLKVGKND